MSVINHHCGSLNHYYVPDHLSNITIEHLKRNPHLLGEIVQSGELYVDTNVDSQTAQALRASGLTLADRSRLDPMMTGLHLGDPRAAEKLLRTLYHNKGIFTGIGEITIHKELVQDLFAGKSQAHIHKNIEPFKDLAAVAGKIGMPIVLHCDAYDLHDQIKGSTNTTQLDGLAKLFADPKLKDTQIIWAHAGGLGRFVSEEHGHTERLQGMLDGNPNLNLDISWSRVASQLTKPEAKQRWMEFLVKNSSRILFGSDTLAPTNNQTWNETKTMYQELFDELEQKHPGVKNQILNENYDRLLVGARAKVREFEDTVLTEEFYNNTLLGTTLKDSTGTPLKDGSDQPLKRVTAEVLQHEIDMKARS